MNETTIFPREKKADFLFEKILNDPWACGKLQETFANYLCYNEDAYDAPLPAEEFKTVCKIRTMSLVTGFRSAP